MGSNYLLTIGALVLLSVFILTTNRGILQSNITMTESEYVITGISLGQALLDEIKTKAFDEMTVSGQVSSPDSMSTVLGTETGESLILPDTSSTAIYSSMILFDDIDDYNGYSRFIETPDTVHYTVSAVVSYANPLNPSSTSVNKTYCKYITINVGSPFITIPISLDYAFTY